ncbi:MAG: reverse transcriptase [Candidatus Brennerbacteria bacterium CG11_big_fil_rev_8_21_14_0_20_43_10]|uniref:Reverse transcriptase n=2 Tax=Candidatus Brenneribacteriota TaxID=1817902 RepID=A0A2M8C262_9BACT|nr:MAG: reverse transcriptase [Candidatus Brennerbacteria bacterium CG11_big_fil_rev_8_21_14_0_20_43_10]PJB50217.1 MAG: reverse transcriptase [Candidatus Brennerbacteria bacterium CG_4_9_14_3_um_filter_43_9]
MINKTIFTFEKLYRAYLDCRENKRNTINALEFEWNLERNLFRLQKELEAKKYRSGRSICFAIKDPSPREIFAADFRDRIVHHLLINEIEGIGERKFIFDTFSCRKGKGTHLAVRRLKSFIRKVTKNYTQRAFYAQLDISGFFMAINHYILYSLFKKLVSKHNKPSWWEKEVLWLAKTIIFNKPTKNYVTKGDVSLFKFIPPRKSLFYSGLHCGLPIGNYSSQFSANLYLNELDQFVKRELKCRYYVRYVDDLILLDRDKENLRHWRNKINNFLEERLSLKLNLDKTKIQPIDNGINFLGYFVKPDYVLVCRRVVSRLKNKLYFLNKNKKETLELNKTLATINSYYGHFKHAFSFNLRKDIYENHLGEKGEKFLPKREYSFLKLMEPF